MEIEMYNVKPSEREEKEHDTATQQHSRGENPGNPVRSPLENKKRINFIKNMG